MRELVRAASAHFWIAEKTEIDPGKDVQDLSYHSKFKDLITSLKSWVESPKKNTWTISNKNQYNSFYIKPCYLCSATCLT